MNVFQRALSKVEGFFSDAEAVVAAFFSSLAHSIAVNGGPVLVAAARSAVAAAEATGGDATTKRDAAFAAVVGTLQSQGLPVVTNAVNGAIEAAVAELQAETATTTSGAAAPVS